MALDLDTAHTGTVGDPTGFWPIEERLTRCAEKGKLTPLLHEVLDLAIGLAGADMATFQLLDPDTECLKLTGSRGFAPAFLKFFETVSANQEVLGSPSFRIDAPDETSSRQLNHARF
jgi:hypothetical protein